MMPMLRRTASILLWALAAVGIVCAGVWAATAAGVVKPLIVISGSMEPGIMTGDLLVAVPVGASELVPGQVASLPSELTRNLVTHRIVSIEEEAPGMLRIAMQGDANEFGDVLDYLVPADASVWVPRLTVPGAGEIVSRLMSPTVAIPLLCGLVGLVGLVWLIPPADRRSNRSAASRANMVGGLA